MSRGSVLLAVTALAAFCIPASAKQEKVRYPNQLIGVWQGGSAACTLPGNLDSDTRMDIRPDELIDYEQWNEPIVVLELSMNPKAWKIKSRLHTDEHSVDQYEIYILSGSDRATLTVVDQSRSVTYARCK